MPAKVRKAKDPGKLATEMVEAVVGSRCLNTVGKGEITPANRDLLKRVIGKDVEEWRQDFGQRLRETASQMLEQISNNLTKIPPAAQAYTLAVLVDKGLAMEGKNSLSTSAVNIQVNNYGDSAQAKQQAISALLGDIPTASLPPQ